MAGDWIKMRTNLHDHPKVIAIAALTGIPELHVVGCLWRVWSWADSHTLDGNAICVTDVTLDRMTAVTGFADALRKVGWLEGRDSAISFPRFAEHNGQTAKNRLETAARVKKHRNAKTVTDVTQKPLPEKRREEKNNNTPLPPLEIPEVLQVDSDFMEAWNLWKTHRRELKKPMKQSQERLLLAQFVDWGSARAIAAIRYTVAKGWQGLREPEKSELPKQTGPRLPTDEEIKNWNPISGGS